MPSVCHDEDLMETLFAFLYAVMGIINWTATHTASEEYIAAAFGPTTVVVWHPGNFVGLQFDCPYGQLTGVIRCRSGVIWADGVAEVRTGDLSTEEQHTR